MNNKKNKYSRQAEQAAAPDTQAAMAPNGMFCPPGGVYPVLSEEELQAKAGVAPAGPCVGAIAPTPCAEAAQGVAAHRADAGAAAAPAPGAEKEEAATNGASFAAAASVAPFEPEAEPPVQAASAKAKREKPKTRRVGTMTLALALIATGAAMLVHVFWPQFSYVDMLRFSPVLLILLGIEILVFNARYKEEKLRYDILSTFIALLLIGGSVGAVVVPEYWYYTVQSQRTASRLASQLQERAFRQLEDLDEFYISGMDWYIDSGSGYLDDTMTADDLMPEHYVQVRVFLPDEYANAEAFARRCSHVARYLTQITPELDYASFYGHHDTGNTAYEGEVRYSLWLENRWQLNDTAENLAGQVYVERWVSAWQHYVSQQEYEAMVENPKSYGLENVLPSLLSPAAQSIADEGGVASFASTEKPSQGESVVASSSAVVSSSALPAESRAVTQEEMDPAGEVKEVG